MKVTAKTDLFDDEGNMIVLVGTTGIITDYDESDDDRPFVFHVTFADGTKTFCEPSELLKFKQTNFIEIP